MRLWLLNQIPGDCLWAEGGLAYTWELADEWSWVGKVLVVVLDFFFFFLAFQCFPLLFDLTWNSCHSELCVDLCLVVIW